MSLFQRSLLSLRTSPRAIRLPSQRALSTTAARAALSENDTNEDKAQRDAKIDGAKQDSVKKAKAGEAEWKPELASNSEQAQAADKHDMSMDEMQKMGEKEAKKDK